MRMRSRGVWRWLPTVVLGLGVTLGPGGAAAELYTWRLDDGSYAFTDDEKAIPARYRDRVEVRPSGGSLRSYARFTPKDDEATRSYEDRLTERLVELRTLNRTLAAQKPRAAAAAPARERVSLRTGRDSGSSIEISADPGSTEPIVVETVFMRRDGGSVVQPVRVTRRGDRVLAIEMPRDREWNVTTDVYDESELRDMMRE